MMLGGSPNNPRRAAREARAEIWRLTHPEEYEAWLRRTERSFRRLSARLKAQQMKDEVKAQEEQARRLRLLSERMKGPKTFLSSVFFGDDPVPHSFPIKYVFPGEAEPTFEETSLEAIQARSAVESLKARDEAKAILRGIRGGSLLLTREKVQNVNKLAIKSMAAALYSGDQNVFDLAKEVLLEAYRLERYSQSRGIAGLGSLGWSVYFASLDMLENLVKMAKTGHNPQMRAELALKGATEIIQKLHQGEEPQLTKEELSLLIEKSVKVIVDANEILGKERIEIPLGFL